MNNKKLLIPYQATRQHIVFVGSTGTGKTQGMMQLFDNLIDKKKVIIDVKGDYTSIYFDDKKDYIFCPFDKRSIGWNIFNDIDSYLDIRVIANALIPATKNSNEEYWNNAGRNILEAVLLYLFKHKTNPKNSDLWNYLTSFEKILEVRDSDDECKALLDFYINEKEQKHTREVLGTIVAKREIRSLESLVNMDGDFSFKKWLENDEIQNQIFLLANPYLIPVVMPTYRTIVEILSNKLLSLDDSNEREVFFWLDEFPRLGRMSKIIDVFTLARSKGGKVVYSLQEFNDLEERYGKELAKVIISNTNTLFILRTTNAKPFEELLGSQEVLEYGESRSMGSVDMSDRITGSKNKKIKPLVLASEIQRLENLEFFLKTIAPNITSAKFVYKKREAKNESFIPVDLKIKKEIEESVENVDKKVDKENSDDVIVV